jgi:mRNA interferase MazF
LKRGDVWLAALEKIRPVLVMSTFTGLNDIQVIPVTSRRRGIATEVNLDTDDGIEFEGVLNAQQLQLLPAGVFIDCIATLAPERMDQVCAAIKEAVGC